MNLFRLICPLKCDCCGTRSYKVINYHQRTCYTNEADNYVNCCPECKIENDAYWDERWEEYNSGRL